MLLSQALCQQAQLGCILIKRGEAPTLQQQQQQQLAMRQQQLGMWVCIAGRCVTGYASSMMLRVQTVYIQLHSAPHVLTELPWDCKVQRVAQQYSV
jgi:hypothetical protein